MIRIRRHKDAMIEEAESVEYEYTLASFFQHEHPIRQTRYVVCWTAGDLEDGQIRFGKGGIRADGPLEAELRTDGWMRLLDFGDHVVSVLPLEGLPGIRVRA